MNRTQKWLLSAALAAPLVLVGCGGDSHRNTADATAVPDSAAASVDAFLAFIMSLSSTDETSEPLTISDNFAVPEDEANEPQPLA